MYIVDDICINGESVGEIGGEGKLGLRVREKLNDVEKRQNRNVRLYLNFSGKILSHFQIEFKCKRQYFRWNPR